MEETISARLTALRALMAEHGVDVYLAPSADEHGNEYLAAHKRRREAISGFTGSAGEVAVCAKEAHLFVDSRYHLQAEQEVSPSLFRLHKMGLEGELDLHGWLAAHNAEAGPLRVGFDPFLFTQADHARLQAALKTEGSALHPISGNLVDQVWGERPPAEVKPAYGLPDNVTGEVVRDKLARVREAMQEANSAALVLTRLDEVAWLTNLRGSAIPYNPVFEGYLLVEGERATCFTDSPLSGPDLQGLAGLVELRPYAEFPKAMAELAVTLTQAGGKFWLDKNSASEGVRLLAGEASLHTIAPNPVLRVKAIKNPIEIDRSREGHLRAGQAKVRAFSHLSARLAEGERISEAGFATLLEQEYASEEGYADLSFGTISAYGANGAIVHYGTPSPEVWLEDGGMLLVDSGIQITGATTDDTRTIAIGTPTPLQRERFTDVLRGHIRLALQVFPEGTTGQALDAIARAPLWNSGLDFGHGTGHGVGAFLNVHEGPQGISPLSTVALAPGMVVSNEPGYYHGGWGGIRLENLYLVEEALGHPPHPAGKRWLRMAPLTMIPFDRHLTDPARMAPDERVWLTEYHQAVAEALLPGLEEPHRAWLQTACRPLDT